MGFANVEKIISAKQKETIIHWSEHDNATKDSEPARYSNKHANHVFPMENYMAHL